MGAIAQNSKSKTMTKTQLKGEGLFYWAKKSDDFAHITHETVDTVLCGKFGALLGNNYAPYLENVCPACAEMYNDEIKTYSVNGEEACPKRLIFAENSMMFDAEDQKLFEEEMKVLDTLKVGETWTSGGASGGEVKRIS